MLHRFKAFLLLVVTLVLYLPTYSAIAQTIPPPNGIVPDGLAAYSVSQGPFTDPRGASWVQWVWNGSSGSESKNINMVSVAGIQIPPDHIVAENPGWTARVTDEGGGKSSIWWVAKPGQTIPPQSWQPFSVLVLGDYSTVPLEGGWCLLAGGYLGQCGKTQVMKW